MNSTVNVPLCPPHTPSRDVWQLHCTVCGVRLFDGISLEQLVGRVETLQQAPVEATGRIRGTWCEVLEEGDGQLWAYWVRPARNIAGYEAVDTTDPEPTGERLSALLLAELAGLPAEGDAGSNRVPDGEIGVAWSRPKAAPRTHRRSRWSRFKRWTARSAEREFLVTATPLLLLWGGVLFTVLGWSGVKAVFAAVWSVVS
ncbi:hypothetical protein [Streptomyces virginiae]|nr:hypothetical protein [Streptomyces virginiae]MBP2343803.1 hypothetical protein [Streptomyces virginiae]